MLDLSDVHGYPLWEVELAELTQRHVGAPLTLTLTLTPTPTLSLSLSLTLSLTLTLTLTRHIGELAELFLAYQA